MPRMSKKMAKRIIQTAKEGYFVGALGLKAWAVLHPEEKATIGFTPPEGSPNVVMEALFSGEVAYVILSNSPDENGDHPYVEEIYYKGARKE